MVNKENVLFCIVGLLVGLIIGFMFANSVNQNATLQKATRQNSNLPAGHPDLSGEGGMTQGGSIPEVQAAIEKARNDPNNFEAQMQAAELFFQIQRFEGALEFLTRANKLKPDDYGVIVQLGNANFDADKYEEAEKWYTTALTKKPDDVNVRTDLGLTFVFRPNPNYDRAIQEFKRSLEKDPNHVQTLQNLTVAYSKKGDLANASYLTTACRAQQPDKLAVKNVSNSKSLFGRTAFFP
jgi:tetratricopeptide (TPR) repeat protein